jgi:uncharacterized protein (UPF0335 family)
MRFGKEQLKAFIERVERLEEEKKAIADDVRDVYAEAKGSGFDVKALRAIVRLRKQDTDERAEGTAATGDQTSREALPHPWAVLYLQSILRDCRRRSCHRMLRRRRTALRVAHGPLQIVYLAGVILTAALEFLDFRGVSRSYGRGV